MAQGRAWWRVQQAGLNPDKLVFLDETWAKTNMVRPRGRSLRGTRLIAKTPHGAWKTTTFLAALRSSGLTAPLVVDGAINGEIFLACLRQVLAPTLRPGDIVVMDNLSSHNCLTSAQRSKVAKRSSCICRRTALTSTRSSKRSVSSNVCCKRRLRAPLTRFWTTCGQLLDEFSPEECRNDIQNCGYRYT